MKYYDEFVKGNWCKKIDVENFIELNYKEYLGDEKFLCKSTPKTNLVMEKVNDLLKKDFQIHVPEGAVKKDGPSAGSALATAIFSAFSGRKIDNNLAMTGEITIRGNVLAIGGLKEKLFACVRAGIQKVLVPAQNKEDIMELPKEITDNLNIVYVNNLREVLKEALID